MLLFLYIIQSLLLRFALFILMLTAGPFHIPNVSGVQLFLSFVDDDSSKSCDCS